MPNSSVNSNSMLKSKTLILILISFSYSMSFGQNQYKIEYLTYANSSLTESQADTIKEMFKKVYYENNQIKKIEFIYNTSNKPKVSIVEYYLNDSESEKDIKAKYNSDSLKVRFIFNKTKIIDSFKIVTSDAEPNFSTLQFPIPNQDSSSIEKTVYDNKNKPIAYLGSATSPSKRKQEQYKIFYNKKGISLLACDYTRKKYEVYSDNDNLNANERKPIEVFNFEDFTKLKQKYFPFQDISYYQNQELEPLTLFIKNYSAEVIPNQVEYLTEIGTPTSKENLQYLSKFSKIKYLGKKVKEIETFGDKSVTLQYYLDNDENLEVVANKLKNKYTNYTILLREELENNYFKETCFIYKKDILVSKNRALRNQSGNIICIEYYDELGFEEIDQSKTIKRYYNENENLIFESHYNNKGEIKEIMLFQPEDFLQFPMRFDSNEKTGRFNYFRDNYFPNEDIQYYKTSVL